jgi:hypothetical protein
MQPKYSLAEARRKTKGSFKQVNRGWSGLHLCDIMANRIAQMLACLVLIILGHSSAVAAPKSDLVVVDLADGRKLSFSLSETPGFIPGFGPVENANETGFSVDRAANPALFALVPAVGSITYSVYVMEPVPPPATDTDPPRTPQISDRLDVTVSTAGVAPGLIRVDVKLVSDPQPNLPTSPPTGSVTVTENGNLIPVGTGFLPLPLAAFFTNISVASDVAPPTISSAGNTVFFNAVTSSVSFSNDIVVGAPGDPILGAAVDLPAFSLDRSTLGEPLVMFNRWDNNTLTIHDGQDIYLRAQIDQLIYDVSQNLFSGNLFGVSLAGVDPTSPFFDSSLANIHSLLLQGLDDFLNPNSALFDSQSSLFITYKPDSDFFVRSDGFLASASSFMITNEITVKMPEPSTVPLLCAGVAGLGVIRRRK